MTETTLFPVILAVPEEEKRHSGREKVRYLSDHARRALEMSARLSGRKLCPAKLSKNENGAPLPHNGVHWSLSHKPDHVAAVTASSPIGIDIERVRPCREGLFRKTADENEWALGRTRSFELFFRYWTAKEAVLKAVGTGLTDLSKCRVVRLDGETGLTMDYRGVCWTVAHFFFEDHMVSVVKTAPHIQWTVYVPDPDVPGGWRMADT